MTAPGYRQMHPQRDSRARACFGPSDSIERRLEFLAELRARNAEARRKAAELAERIRLEEEARAAERYAIAVLEGRR
jgi:hypothetical protein